MPFVSRRKKPASYCPSHYEWLFPWCGSEGIPDMAGELSKPRRAFFWPVPCHLIISDSVTSLSSAQTSLSLLVTIITHALVFTSTTFTELPEWARLCCEEVGGRTRRGNQTCACFQGAYRPGREWTAVGALGLASAGWVRLWEKNMVTATILEPLLCAALCTDRFMDSLALSTPLREKPDLSFIGEGAEAQVKSFTKGGTGSHIQDLSLFPKWYLLSLRPSRLATLVYLQSLYFVSLRKKKKRFYVFL